jgi:hypothetical protein
MQGRLGNMEFFLEQLNNTAEEAVGHFFLAWTKSDTPCITDPWKHNECQKRHGSAYGEFSHYLFNNECQIAQLLEEENFDTEDMTFIKEFNENCDLILASIDDEEIDLSFI